MSPHPSLYQNTPTGSFYNRASTSSVPTLNPEAPLERRRKEAPEGPQAGVGDKKGKKKAVADSRSPGPAHDTGKGTAEIAPDSKTGAHMDITTNDSEGDADSGPHKSLQKPASQHRQGQEDDGPTGEGSRLQEGDSRGGITGGNKSPQYGVGGEDEFQNVWGK